MGHTAVPVNPGPRDGFSRTRPVEEGSSRSLPGFLIPGIPMTHRAGFIHCIASGFFRKADSAMALSAAIGGRILNFQEVGTGIVPIFFQIHHGTDAPFF